MFPFEENCMDLMPVLPIALIVLFWAIIFVVCFTFFTRTLRLPTESEIEAAHEHLAVEEGIEAQPH
jgi:hypothetical protein